MKYDLVSRCLKFAQEIRDLVRELPPSISNFQYSKQLIRSSSSVGANYIEANQGLGEKDFLMRLKIARKECAESHFWLNLIDTENEYQKQTLLKLLDEATQLTKILSVIINKSRK